MQIQGMKIGTLDALQYRGFLDCLLQTYRRFGLKGVYRGVGLTMLRQSTSLGVYFSTYDLLKRLLLDLTTTSTATLAPLQTMVAGGSAGAMAWIVVNPVDVVKSRFQAEDVINGRSKYSGYLDCVKKSYQEKGLKVFGSGLSSSLLRTIPANAIVFLTVESVRKLCYS